MQEKREQKYSIPNMHEWRDDEFQATSRLLFDQNFFVFNDNHVFAIARIIFWVCICSSILELECLSLECKTRVSIDGTICGQVWLKLVTCLLKYVQIICLELLPYMDKFNR